MLIFFKYATAVLLDDGDLVDPEIAHARDLGSKVLVQLRLFPQRSEGPLTVHSDDELLGALDEGDARLALVVDGEEYPVALAPRELQGLPFQRERCPRSLVNVVVIHLWEVQQDSL